MEHVTVIVCSILQIIYNILIYCKYLILIANNVNTFWYWTSLTGSDAVTGVSVSQLIRSLGRSPSELLHL